MTCWLVRHGKDDDTVRGGWSSHGLTSDGMKQVQDLAWELSEKPLNIGMICSSDLCRAEETARILAQPLGLPVMFLPQFRETDNGALAGMKHELAEQKYPGLYWSTLEYDECYPGGESPRLFFERIQGAWLRFREEMAKQDRDVILVTHAGVIEAILCMEHHLPFSNRKKRFKVPHAALIPVQL